MNYCFDDDFSVDIRKPFNPLLGFLENQHYMTYEYFSDKENGSRELSSEEISLDVWNAIIATYDKFVKNCALASEFPEECPDGSTVCGCNRRQLEDALKGEVPELSLPVCERYYDEDNLPNKYAVLDFLQFVYRHIKDPIEIDYHSYYKHNHYSFSDKGSFKYQFRERVNTIFRRNGIVFFLDVDGQIKRSIPKSIAKIITDIRFNTGDERLNGLLDIAYSKFILPRSESRVESLEKIWDAFERLKTYFEKNKKLSAKQLVDVVSEKNSLFREKIENEFNELTIIGNDFQIRHFECDKIQLESNLQIDYFFYRMSCLIHLCVESLKIGQF